MWKCAKQLAKRLPAIKRLVEQRDALANKVTTLQARVAEMEQTVEQWTSMRAAGQLIELDYPVIPRCRNWKETPALIAFTQRLINGQQHYAADLQKMASLRELIWSIPESAEESEPTPRWVNGWLPGLDAISLMHFTLERSPNTVWEIGSGNSTKFFRKAIQYGKLPTRIVSIDPHPRVEIDALSDLIIRDRLESLEIACFDEVQPGDIFFVDNSHRALQNSDVTVFFSEILPMLPAGVLVGIHDIFLPHDYPEEWLNRFYNEQYLLLAYLHNNVKDSIVFPCAFVSEKPELMGALDEIFAHPSMHAVERHGDLFWILKG